MFGHTLYPAYITAATVRPAQSSGMGVQCMIKHAAFSVNSLFVALHGSID